MEQEQSIISQTEQVSVGKQKISSVSALLKKAIGIYKQGFKKFFGMIFLAPLIGSLPLIAVLAIFAILKFIGFEPLAVQIILGIFGFVGIIIIIYVFTVAKIGIYLLLKSYSQDIKVKEAFKQARKYFWKYIIVSFATAVFVFLWSLLFIIPGLIFAVYYSFAVWALIFEDYESTSALKRSKELVKGYWWAVVGRSLFIGLLALIFFMVLSIPALFFGEESIYTDIWGFVLQIILLIISPIFIIYNYLVYNDLTNIKKESQVERKKSGKIMTMFVVAILLLFIFILLIPKALSLFWGEDISMPNNSDLRLSVINIPEDENSYYDLIKIKDVIYIPEDIKLYKEFLESGTWDNEIVVDLLKKNEQAF